MKTLVKKAIRVCLTPFVLGDYFKFKKADKSPRFPVRLGDFYPQVKDKTITTGFDRHYVYHTSWAARVVKEINPAFHVDISSSLYFCGLVSAFIPVRFYDYRPADLRLSGLETHEGNLHNLPFANETVNSLSCLHTIEQIAWTVSSPTIPSTLKATSKLPRN